MSKETTRHKLNVTSIYVAVWVPFDLYMSEEDQAKYNMLESWLNYRDLLGEKIKTWFKEYFPEAIVDAFIPRDHSERGVSFQATPDDDTFTMWGKDMVEHLEDEVFGYKGWLVEKEEVENE